MSLGAVPAGSESLSAFAERLTGRRLEAFSAELDRARADTSPDAVHDLRVSGRRLLAAMDCFRDLLRDDKVRVLRKRVKAVLKAGGAVRDRDIALELAGEARLDRRSSLVAELGRQRELAAGKLAAKVNRKRYRDFAAKWARKLRMPRVRPAALPERGGSASG